MGKIGQVSDGNAGKLQGRILIVDPAFRFFVCDFAGSNTPQRRPIWFVLAFLAGREYGKLKNRRVAIDARCPLGGNS